MATFTFVDVIEIPLNDRVDDEYLAPLFYHYQGETTQSKETWLQEFDLINQFTWQMCTDIGTASAAATRANIAKFQKELIPAAVKVAFWFASAIK